MLKYCIYVILGWLVVSTSCRREYSCEKCGNKPPIANAGNDAKLILPLDSLTLDGKASADPDGKITSWNHGAEKIFGYSSKEIIGKQISILIPPYRQNEEKEIMKKIQHMI